MRPAARPGQFVISGSFSSLDDPEAGWKAIAHLRDLEAEGVRGARIKMHGLNFWTLSKRPLILSMKVVS
jgi:hypothetical protein